MKNATFSLLVVMMVPLTPLSVPLKSRTLLSLPSSKFPSPEVNDSPNLLEVDSMLAGPVY